MWQIQCQCGHKDWFGAFTTFQGRPLKASQWHCKACDCAWQVTKEGLKVIRQPRPQKEAA